MQIVRGGAREVKVDYMADRRDVETARGQISGYEDFASFFLVTEPAEVLIPVLGWDLSVQRCCLEVLLGE